MDLEEPTPEWHAEQRRRDQEDIAQGRRTPEQVNRDNGLMPNPEEWTLLNMIEATRALRKHL